MKYSRLYRLKRRNIILKEEVEFRFFIDEIFWVIKMRVRGFKVNRIK